MGVRKEGSRSAPAPHEHARPWLVRVVAAILGRARGTETDKNEVAPLLRLTSTRGAQHGSVLDAIAPRPVGNYASTKAGARGGASSLRLRLGPCPRCAAVLWGVERSTDPDRAWIACERCGARSGAVSAPWLNGRPITPAAAFALLEALLKAGRR